MAFSEALGRQVKVPLQLLWPSFVASQYENTEHEEAVPIHRDAIAWLVGNGGERIRTFIKEHGVYARVARAVGAAGIVEAEDAWRRESLGLGPVQLAARLDDLAEVVAILGGQAGGPRWRRPRRVRRFEQLGRRCH